MLMSAVADAAIVRALLDAGADPNSCVRVSGISALMWASLATPEVVRMLLEAGADPNASESHSTGGTPIQWAMNDRKTDTEIIRLLIDYGANVNARNWLGETPLYLAARHRRIDLVRLLLSAGADPHVASREGFTAWSWSYGFRRRNIRAELLKHIS
jgi:ankyrin repeat protein